MKETLRKAWSRAGAANYAKKTKAAETKVDWVHDQREAEKKAKGEDQKVKKADGWNSAEV